MPGAATTAMAGGQGPASRPAGAGPGGAGGPGAGGGGMGRGGMGGGRQGQGGGMGDRRTVWALRAGVPTPIPVKIGITDGTNTEIADGELKEGDDVITESTGDAGGAQQGPANAFRRVF
jgi:HlyD family secretion protein